MLYRWKDLLYDTEITWKMIEDHGAGRFRGRRRHQKPLQGLSCVLLCCVVSGFLLLAATGIVKVVLFLVSDVLCGA